jgi:type VI protein secretion system component Hcp
MFETFFRRLRRPGRPTSRPRCPARRQVRPRLEPLEDRTLLQASAVQLAATPNPSTPAQPSAQIALSLFKNPMNSLTFDVSAYHFSLNNPAAAARATGRAEAGTVRLNDFVLDLPISSVSPLLLQALVRRERFGRASVSVATPDGKPFLRWSLDGVFVTRLRLTTKGSSAPQVEVDLTFDRIAGTVLQGQPGASSNSAPPFSLQLAGVMGGFVNGVLALDGFTFDAQHPSPGRATLRGLLVQLPAGEGTQPLFGLTVSGRRLSRGVLSAAFAKGFLTLNLDTFFVSQFTESADVMAPEPVTDEANLAFNILQVIETPASGGRPTGPSVLQMWNQLTNTDRTVRRIGTVPP